MWSFDNFRPKYDMRPINANSMFMQAQYLKGDLQEHLDNLGVALDFSNATITSSIFNGCVNLTRVGVINVSKGSSLSMIFYNCRYLVTIDKLILKDDGTQVLSNAFSYASALKNILIEGKIGSSLDFKNSNLLTLASMKSIISALFDYSGTTNEGKYTLSLASTCWDRLEADSTSPTGSTWKDYVISLGWLT